MVSSNCFMLGNVPKTSFVNGLSKVFIVTARI